MKAAIATVVAYLPNDVSILITLMMDALIAAENFSIIKNRASECIPKNTKTKCKKKKQKERTNL